MPLYELVLIATKKVPKSFFDSTRKTFIAANDKPGLANFERLWTTSQKESAEQTRVKLVHKSLLKSLATSVLDKGGVVRKFENLGQKTLGHTVKRYQSNHTEGHFFTMTFDASPKIVSDVNLACRLNEAVVRFTILKKGENLKHVSEYTPPENRV